MRRQVLSAVILHDKSASEYCIAYIHYALIGKDVKGKKWILMDGK
jgi:hypothetical protein